MGNPESWLGMALWDKFGFMASKGKYIDGKIQTLQHALCCCVFAFIGLFLSGLCTLSAEEGLLNPTPEHVDEISDAEVLADRILRRQSSGLLLNPKRRDRLAREIGQVLDQVRTAYPPAWEVSPRVDFRPGILLVGLTPALLSAAVPAGRNEGQPTGHVEFDDLNTRLGLSDMRIFLHVGAALLEFSKYVHLEAAARAYLEIPGVRFAHPDAQLGDGPDIEVVRVQETWYVIVRKAWGDCPSGCLHEELFFFIVENDVARRVEAAEAMQEPAFAKLAAIRDWH